MTFEATQKQLNDAQEKVDVIRARLTEVRAAQEECAAAMRAAALDEEAFGELVGKRAGIDARAIALSEALAEAEQALVAARAESASAEIAFREARIAQLTKEIAAQEKSFDAKIRAAFASLNAQAEPLRLLVDERGENERALQQLRGGMFTGVSPSFLLPARAYIAQVANAYRFGTEH